MLNLSKESLMAGAIHGVVAAAFLAFYNGVPVFSVDVLMTGALIMFAGLMIDFVWPRHPGLD
jgi:hypothetical protein